MSVSQLEKEFAQPSVAYRAKPFWAWNDKLEEPELRRQIRIFRQMGMGGFFMHSRVGLKTSYLSPEWFDLVRACIDEAGKCKTEAWLYDEDRWPSGPAGGLVTRDPQYSVHRLVLKRHARPEHFLWPQKDSISYIYGATFEDDKISWYKKLDQPADLLILPQGAEILEFSLELPPSIPWFNNTTYLDTMNPDAVAKFIDVTHEAYRREVGNHFGKEVPGIFTDEPNRGPVFRDLWNSGSTLTWTFKLPERFQEMYDYDILLHIPELVFDLVDKPASQVRYHYYCCTSRLFAESFAKQIGEWCEKNHLLFTGHVLEEVPLANAVSVVGSAMQFYPYMQAPGIDILTQYQIEYITAKQCSSVARQCGRKWVLSELYGCTGWETTFETYKHSGDWQAALGITMRCPHLSWYSMAGEAKRDYPASIHFHSPWWQQYKVVEDHFSRVNVLLTAGTPVCDLAVIHPIESLYLLYGPNWQNDGSLKKLDEAYKNLVTWLLGEHMDFDFADEHLLVEFAAAVQKDQDGVFLQIGRMKYRAVLAGPMLTIRKTTLELLKQFAQAGGKVVFAGTVPEYIEALPSEDVKIFAQDKTVALTAADIAGALEDQVRKVNIRDAQGEEITDILYQFRQAGDDWILFMANTNRQIGYDRVNVHLQLNLPKGGQIQLWDTQSGQKSKIIGELSYKSATFKIDIAPSGSRLIVISSQPQDLPAYSVPNPIGKEMTLGDEGWSFLLDDYNVILLDRPDALLQADGKKKWSRSKTEILQLDREIRRYLGLELRGGEMVQPWVTKDHPLGPTGQLTLTYRFGVKNLPVTPVLLALEQPERWTIKINGRRINSDSASGWWVDPAIKTLPIEPALLARGKNFLTLEGQFDRLADLEIVYLLGSFGVETDGKNVTMTKMPSRLELGNWCDQGLPFYSGNVVYRTTFDFQATPNVRYFLNLKKFQATAVEVTINEKEPIVLGWPKFQIDCTSLLQAGKNTIDIKLLGSRRNSFGPMHLANENPIWCGPFSFIDNPENPNEWQDEYKLRGYGLYEPPTLIGYEG